MFLVKRERKYPIRLKREEALLRRIPLHHEKRDDIKRNIRKGRAGFKGEEVLDYHLSFLPEDEFLLFHDLRLSYKNRFFQIDTLILSLQAAIIIESKNIYGHLFFDVQTKQVIRTFDTKKEGFPDPLLQARRHAKQLNGWLLQHMMKPVPIHCLVSIGHPGTLIETQPGNYHLFKQIIHAEHIPDQIEDFIKKHPEPKLTPYQLKKISDLLLKEHTPQEIPIFSSYGIDPAELLLGIACPHCSRIPMNRKHGTWYCTHCKYESKDAHIQVIADHLLLHGQITNQQCRQLLAIDQPDTVKRLLKSMDLPYTGNGSDRVYYLKRE